MAKIKNPTTELLAAELTIEAGVEIRRISAGMFSVENYFSGGGIWVSSP